MSLQFTFRYVSKRDIFAFRSVLHVFIDTQLRSLKISNKVPLTMLHYTLINLSQVTSNLEPTELSIIVIFVSMVLPEILKKRSHGTFGQSLTNELFLTEI